MALVWLRYIAPGGSLSFHDSEGRRVKVNPGERFQTDEATAETLLGDRWVRPADEPPPVDLEVAPDVMPAGTEEFVEDVLGEDDEDGDEVPDAGALAAIPAPVDDVPPPPASTGAINITDLPSSAKVGGVRRKKG